MSDLLSLLIERSPLGGKTARDQDGRPPLGNLANNSSPARRTEAPDTARTMRRWARRRERHGLRGQIRSLTAIPRIGQCGYVTVGGPGGGPGLRVSSTAAGSVAGLSGLSTCGSVWACPVCSAKIATARAADLAVVMRKSLESGCSASMVTLTMRHHEGQRLADCWEALAGAWGAVTSGKQWASDKARYGLRGWVKAVEVTRGKSGWHVHLHALLIWSGDVSVWDARTVGRRMWQRWDAGLGRRGFTSLRDQGGVDVRMASLVPGENGLHEYFVKLAHEITGGQAKLARGGGRTPFQIAADIFAAGVADDVAAWGEWEQASRGRRQIAWSQGLREWAGLGAEQTDEQIAADEPGGDEMLFLDPDSWRALRADPGAVCDLLEKTEEGGYPAARRWLTVRGLIWHMLKRSRQ